MRGAQNSYNLIHGRLAQLAAHHIDIVGVTCSSHVSPNKTPKTFCLGVLLLFADENTTRRSLVLFEREGAECGGVFFGRNEVSEKKKPETRLMRPRKIVTYRPKRRGKASLFYIRDENTTMVQIITPCYHLKLILRVSPSECHGISYLLIYFKNSWALGHCFLIHLKTNHPNSPYNLHFHKI